MVGRRLAALPQGWHTLHAVAVGTRGADIDHVVIGPPGVFTVNAKHHPKARVWVGGDVVMVNGRRQPYLRNSRHEATRAARLLTAAAGRAVTASAIIALVGADSLTIATAPKPGVVVLGRKGLVRWLLAQPGRLTPAEVTQLHTLARRSTTWR